MASALESAHRAGLVHRDVKPSNILVTTFGAPVLADFGISSSLTRATRRRGAGDVDPVERARGHRTSRRPAPSRARCGASVRRSTRCWPATARSNDATAARTRKEQLRRRIARATYTDIARADVPASLQDVLARSMSRDPRERYASAREFADALRGVQSELGLSPTPLEIAADGLVAGFGVGRLRRHASCVVPRAAASSAKTAARPAPDPASPGSRATRTPSSPRPSGQRRGVAWTVSGVRRGRRRRRLVGVPGACCLTGDASDAAPHRGGTGRDRGRRRAGRRRERGVAGARRAGDRKVDTAVWALQTGDGRRYARVNTAIDELDTVRDVSNPSAGRRRATTAPTCSRTATPS